MWRCSSCSEMNPDSAKFCQSCGERKKEVKVKPIVASVPDVPSRSQVPVHIAPTITITTTPTIEGKAIQKYLDVVCGTSIYLVGGAFGGGLSNQENLYGTALSSAKSKMIQKAITMGANAIVGVQTSVTSPGGLNNIIVIITGTAVVLED